MSSRSMPSYLHPLRAVTPQCADPTPRAIRAVSQALLRLWKLIKPGDRETATDLLTMARGFEREMPTLASELRIIAMRGMAGRD